MCINELLVNDLTVSFDLLSATSGFDVILIVFLGLLSVRRFNKSVVEILEALNVRDAEKLMVLIRSLLERVVINSEYLQVVLKPFEIDDRVFKVSDLVGADRKDIQLVEVVNSLDDLNLVLVEGEVLKFDELAESFHGLNQVKAQVEPR